MAHIAADCRTPDLAYRLSLVPLLCGNLVETLRSDGASIPGEIKDYLVSASGDLGLVDAEQWDLLHIEYLREVFGAFGDSSKVVSEEALLTPELLALPYVSSLFETSRESLRSSIRAGAHLRDLPRWRWVTDPFSAAHWRIVQATDRLVSSRYQDFLMAIGANKADDLHRSFLASSGLSRLAHARTSSDVRASIEMVLIEAGAIRLDSRRCTRSCLVLSAAVNEQLDFVLVFDELRGPGSGADGRFRPFIRLISAQAKHMAGSSAEGVVLQVPINELIPGAYIYGQTSSPQAFALGFAFNVRLFELLAPAFVATVNNELPTAEKNA